MQVEVPNITHTSMAKDSTKNIVFLKKCVKIVWKSLEKIGNPLEIIANAWEMHWKSIGNDWESIGNRWVPLIPLANPLGIIEFYFP